MKSSSSKYHAEGFRPWLPGERQKWTRAFSQYHGQNHRRNHRLFRKDSPVMVRDRDSVSDWGISLGPPAGPLSGLKSWPPSSLGDSRKIPCRPYLWSPFRSRAPPFLESRAYSPANDFLLTFQPGFLSSCRMASSVMALKWFPVSSTTFLMSLPSPGGGGYKPKRMSPHP